MVPPPPPPNSQSEPLPLLLSYSRVKGNGWHNLAALTRLFGGTGNNSVPFGSSCGLSGCFCHFWALSSTLFSVGKSAFPAVFLTDGECAPPCFFWHDVRCVSAP